MEGITPVRAYSEEGLKWSKAVQVKYYDLTASNTKLHEFLTVPLHLKELAIGFLYSNAYVEDPESIEKIFIDENSIVVELSPDFEFKMKYLKDTGIHPLENIEIAPVTNGKKITREKILEKVGKVFSSTTDLPYAVISDSNGYFFVTEDISSTTAFYKAVGKAVTDHFDLRSSFILFSDFLLPENVVRAAYLGIPIVGTMKMPTDLSLTVAESLGITVFSVSLDGVYVYTHPSRIQ